MEQDCPPACSGSRTKLSMHNTTQTKHALGTASLTHSHCTSMQSVQAMGIIDDHYGGYENLALYSDGHGGFDMEAAYGTTFESTIDARIKAVCGGSFPIGSNCGSYDSQDCGSDENDFDEEDSPLVDAMRAFLTSTKIEGVNEQCKA